MKHFTFKQVGGGQKLSNPNSQTLQSSKNSFCFFKPIIATSLSLALGSMSFASTPTLKIGDQTLGSGTPLGNINLEGDNSWKANNTHTLTWDLIGDIYTPKGTGFSSVNNSPIDSLMLEFINNNSMTSTTMVVNKQDAKGIFAAIRPASTETSLELDFHSKGL